MKPRPKTYTGQESQDVSIREERNRALARRAAAESMVLLKNDGVLPLTKGERIVLVGSGATQTVKGGTGSGDVNERENTGIRQGLGNAGFVIVNEAWLTEYDMEYYTARDRWRREIIRKSRQSPGNISALIDAYFETGFTRPVGRPLSEHECTQARTDTAIYILSRSAGEGADRKAGPGDYYLDETEKNQLRELRLSFTRIIAVLNCGGPVDLSFFDELSVNAIIHLSQPGMEGGSALADIITGDITPSGKMTDTWAYDYGDYPNSGTYSHNNGNVEKEFYNEGIYVGYRYFDSFGVQPRISFGFGLSYTTFSITTSGVSISRRQDGEPGIEVVLSVRNSGNNFSGREVVQVYARCPHGSLQKEYQRLCAFVKTPLLDPGKECSIVLNFPVSQLASYSEADSGWVLEPGDYLIAVGNSSSSNSVEAVLRLDAKVITQKTDIICPTGDPLEEIEPGTPPAREYNEGVAVIDLAAGDIPTKVISYRAETPERITGRAGALVETMDKEQLLHLACGDPAKGQNVSSDVRGTDEIIVPGAAGETSSCVSGEPWNIADIVLADGPAGLRLAQHYDVTAEGRIIKPGFVDSIEHGFFAEPRNIPGTKRRYQFATAFPVGTMLAQSWDIDLMKEIGRGVAEEMEEYGITLWLAPGMNIHRNPLGGRNFEYYSEDPLLSGVMASAITSGVQSRKGVGTTIKHLACNNQEANRKHSDSIVSQRALREIYLRGFEIAVKHSQPMAIMTSYNLLNGLHTANSYDLITKAARDEWGFAGLVISDWSTTGDGGSSPVECMKAGNDLIMPGEDSDMARIRSALNGTGAETLDIQELKKCVANLVNIVLQSNRYENCRSYSEQFVGMTPFIEYRAHFGNP